MARHDRDAIPAPNPADRQSGDKIAAHAPPQRRPNDLARSDDLGGVIDPRDDDLIEAGGWSSWSMGERLTVLAGFVVVFAVVAVIVVTLVA